MPRVPKKLRLLREHARKARLRRYPEAEDPVKTAVKTEERSSFDNQCTSAQISTNLPKIKCESTEEGWNTSFSSGINNSTVALAVKNESTDGIPSTSNAIVIQLPKELEDPTLLYHPKCLTPKVSSIGNEMGSVITKPNFDVVTFKYGGKDLNRLVIYKIDDPSLCIEYEYNRCEKLYYCNACSRQGCKVTAKVAEKPEPAVFLEKAKHLCSYGKTRSPQFTFTNAILRSPDAKLSHVKENNGTFSLTVYTSEDQKLCYKYKFNRGSNKYFCIECKKKREKTTAKVFFDSNDEYFVQLDDQIHACQPFCEIEEVVKDPLKFELKHTNDESSSPNLIVYCFEDRKHAYELTHQRIDSYSCYSCFKLCGKRITYARMALNNVFCRAPHICQPRLVVSSPSINYALPAVKNDDTSGHEIIPSSMFEIKYFNNNHLHQILVFCKENRNYCYELAPLPSEASYYCVKCNEINDLWEPCANLRQYLNGDYYLEVSNNTHACQPRPYSSENLEKTIHYPNFSIYNRGDSNPKNQRIIVFASEDKKLFYEFVWLTKRWRCQNCTRQHRDVNVKLMTFDDGTEYLMMGKYFDHVCEPQTDFAGIYSRNL